MCFLPPHLNFSQTEVPRKSSRENEQQSRTTGVEMTAKQFLHRCCGAVGVVFMTVVGGDGAFFLSFFCIRLDSRVSLFVNTAANFLVVARD